MPTKISYEPEFERLRELPTPDLGMLSLALGIAAALYWAQMRFGNFSFGRIRIDGVLYDHDLVIDRGEVRKRKKKASKKFRAEFGHTPLSLEEKIPWKCRRLVIGTGRTGGLPVMETIIVEAKRRGVELTVLPTGEAIGQLRLGGNEINAILHLTC